MIRQAQQIINACPVISGQPDQQLVCPLLHARFQIAIFPLGDADSLRDLLLLQIPVFSHCLDPRLHGITPYEDTLDKIYLLHFR